jgi:hypothetical protein
MLLSSRMNLSGLVTAAAPNPINLYGLVASTPWPLTRKIAWFGGSPVQNPEGSLVGVDYRCRIVGEELAYSGDQDGPCNATVKAWQPQIGRDGINEITLRPSRSLATPDS